VVLHAPFNGIISSLGQPTMVDAVVQAIRLAYYAMPGVITHSETVFAFGVQVATISPAGTVGALPTAGGDADSDWLLHQFVVFPPTGAPGTEDQRYMAKWQDTLVSKARRKLRSEDALVLSYEVPTLAGGGSVNFNFGYRALFKGR